MIIVGLIGIIIGSFLNVCIYRIPKEESIVFPNSHCTTCEHNLNIFDLVPMFSWIFFRGRCRYCGVKVSKQYPIIEGITGLLFMFLYFKFGFTIEFLKYLVLTSILIVLAVIDIKTKYVYDSVISILGISGVVFILIEFFINKEVNVFNIIFGVIIPSIIVTIFAYFKSMGWGDVEVIACVGLFLGFKLNMLNLYISIIIAGIYSIFLIIFRKIYKKQTIAFVPYIAFSSYVTIIFGNEILCWYLKFIN